MPPRNKTSTIATMFLIAALFCIFAFGLPVLGKVQTVGQLFISLGFAFGAVYIGWTLRDRYMRNR